MDMIARAIEENRHICNEINLQKQTWEILKEDAKGKKIYALGSGNGMGYLLRNCYGEIKLEGVLDNNVKKQNKKLAEICPDAERTEYAGIYIQSPDTLRRNQGQDVIILVTVINSYTSLIAQLKEMKITHYYFLLMLEYNRRKQLGDKVQEDVLLEYMEWCWKQKIDPKKIVMLIGIYGGHAIEITKALLKWGKEFDIVWIVEDLNIEKPEGVRLILHRNQREFTYEMATARLWIFDDIVPQDIKKKQGQTYIQVKHWSSITLKKFFLDDYDVQKSEKLQEIIKSDGARMDYLFSGSAFDEEACRSGFRFQGEAVRVGSPRSDILFDDSVKEKVYKYFKIEKKAKLCLYVPTYRNQQLKNDYKPFVPLNIEKLLDVLKQKWNGNWYFMMRVHPGLCLETGALFEHANVRDAGDYFNSEELVAASDVLITDYSSIMFEGAYINKPTFLYAPDRNMYVEKERGFLIKYDELPFPISECDDELEKCILNFKKEKYDRAVNIFLKQYGIHEDGRAGIRAAEFIRKKIFKMDEKQ